MTRTCATWWCSKPSEEWEIGSRGATWEVLMSRHYSYDHKSIVIKVQNTVLKIESRGECRLDGRTSLTTWLWLLLYYKWNTTANVLTSFTLSTNYWKTFYTSNFLRVLYFQSIWLNMQHYEELKIDIPFIIPIAPESFSKSI